MPLLFGLFSFKVDNFQFLELDALKMIIYQATHNNLTKHQELILIILI
ncbi:hypothetical protein GARC_2301 [Paraglaciecola arctica BSs20135]|uniref:Uncharacterized protein n=1 Tax=Paraglaciecola arctica BSs20135 TaxID=493475 RepID=K6YRG9_9ALTE|nr:hypothetical protein GARC_2301 [Paraglaciecola arctica BSs20135]